MVNRPCLDCGRPSPDTRCEPCRLEHGRAREHNRDRPTAHERGYDSEYITNRALVLAASDVCWLCGHAGAGQADHVIPRSRGGTNHVSNLRPAHGNTTPCPICDRRCNQERGDAA